MDKKYLFLFFVIIIILLAVVSFYNTTTSIWEVNSFDDCVKEGNPVMESYPRQCISKSGKHFVEDISND